jgi:methyl-accepting chemotaxis protein
MKLSNIRVGTRIAIAFALVVALLVVIVLTGITSGSSQARATSSVAEDQQLTADVMQAKFRSADLNGWQTAYAFDANLGTKNATSDQGESRAAFLGSADQFATELQRVRKHVLTDAQTREVEAASDSFDQFMRNDNVVIAGYRRGDPQSVANSNKLVTGEELTLFDRIEKNMERLSTSVEKESTAAEAHAHDVAASSRTMMLVASAIALAIAALCAVVMTRSITRPIAKCLAVLKAVAGKDLTHQADVAGKDELAEMATALNTSVGSIRETLNTIGESSRLLAASSEELAAVSQQMSGSSEETATQATVVSAAAEQISANVSTVASATEEMTSSIREIAATRRARRRWRPKRRRPRPRPTTRSPSCTSRRSGSATSSA